MADGEGLSSLYGIKADAAEILVAIPTLNEQAHIERCVASLMDGDPRLARVQFVVSDGGSTDATREILERLAARYANLSWIDNPGRLQSAAINRVVEQFGSVRTILVRCDAHSVYPEGYVTQVADAMKKLGVASLVVPMDAVGQGCFQRANAWVVDTPLGSGGSPHRGGKSSGYVDHGHHAGFDLSFYTAVGGYDETFSHNEDAEYDARVAAAGGKVYLDSSIRLQYYPRATIGGLARQYFNYGKGRARTLRKHRLRPKIRQLFPIASLLAVIGSVLVAPVLPLALVYPAIYFGGLMVASIWIALSKRSICGLGAGLAAATMHMAWAAGFLRQTFFRR